jgi:hypothetical protein
MVFPLDGFTETSSSNGGRGLSVSCPLEIPVVTAVRSNEKRMNLSDIGRINANLIKNESDLDILFLYLYP